MPTTAAAAEATAQPITVTWRDLQFEVAPRDRWTLRAIEAIRDGDWLVAVHRLLGDEQWQRFTTADPEPVAADLADFVTALAQALGFADEGESSASSDS